jgi:hypothetical protein
MYHHMNQDNQVYAIDTYWQPNDTTASMKTFEATFTAPGKAPLEHQKLFWQVALMTSATDKAANNDLDFVRCARAIAIIGRLRMDESK